MPKPRIRPVLAALGIFAALATAGPGVANAAPEAPRDVEPLSASGCTGRNGPGDVSRTCIEVDGAGNHVRFIEGSMKTNNWSGWPQLLCDVRVHVWGTLRTGAAFDKVSNAGCSRIGYAYVEWSVWNYFKTNSKVCARTLWDDEWSNPACITIK